MLIALHLRPEAFRDQRFVDCTAWNSGFELSVSIIPAASHCPCCLPNSEPYCCVNKDPHWVWLDGHHDDEDRHESDNKSDVLFHENEHEDYVAGRCLRMMMVTLMTMMMMMTTHAAITTTSMARCISLL